MDMASRTATSTIPNDWIAPRFLVVETKATRWFGFVGKLNLFVRVWRGSELIYTANTAPLIRMFFQLRLAEAFLASLSATIAAGWHADDKKCVLRGRKCVEKRNGSPLNPFAACLCKERPPKTFSKRGESESKSNEIFAESFHVHQFISSK